MLIYSISLVLERAGKHFNDQKLALTNTATRGTTRFQNDDADVVELVDTSVLEADALRVRVQVSPSALICPRFFQNFKKLEIDLELDFEIPHTRFSIHQIEP